MSARTNGICERVYQTILNEFYQVTFQKKVYSELEPLPIGTSVDTREILEKHKGVSTNV
jgi:hypothetical protein